LGLTRRPGAAIENVSRIFDLHGPGWRYEVLGRCGNLMAESHINQRDDAQRIVDIVSDLCVQVVLTPAIPIQINPPSIGMTKAWPQRGGSGSRF
jgi:hypothetical protein